MRISRTWFARALVATVTAGTVAISGVGTAGAATAAPSRVAVTAQAAPVAPAGAGTEGLVRPADQIWTHWGTYFGLGTCLAAGELGRQRGDWDTYSCTRSSGLWFDLWVVLN